MIGEYYRDPLPGDIATCWPLDDADVEGLTASEVDEKLAYVIACKDGWCCCLIAGQLCRVCAVALEVIERGKPARAALFRTFC